MFIIIYIVSCNNSQSKIKKDEILQKHAINDTLKYTSTYLKNDFLEAIEIINYSNDKRYILILKNKIHYDSIVLPQKYDLQGYSTLRVNLDKNYLNFTIEYGSINYNKKEFIFINDNDTYYLYKMKVSTFNKKNPEILFDKDFIIKKRIPLSEFNLYDYLN